MTRTLVAKKRCCKDKPRCKSCPVTLKRLSSEGLLERTGKREYELVGKLPKKAVKAARAR